MIQFVFNIEISGAMKASDNECLKLQRANPRMAEMTRLERVKEADKLRKFVQGVCLTIVEPTLSYRKYRKAADILLQA